MLIGPGDDATSIADLARAGPITRVIDVLLSWADNMRLQIDSEVLGDFCGSVRPCFAAQASKERERPTARQIQGGVFSTLIIKQPSVRNTCAGPSRGLVMQVSVERKVRLNLAICDGRIGGIALVHFNAMGVKFILLKGNRSVERVALRLGLWRAVTSRVHVGLDLFHIRAACHAKRLEYGAEFADRLVGAGDDLLGDRCAFGGIAIEQLFTSFAFDDSSDFPGQIERILNGSV